MSTSIITRDLPQPPSAKRLEWLLGVATMVALFIVFWPVFQADFVAWEDSSNIYANPHIQELSGGNLKWMLSHSQNGLDYQPLAWFAWALMYKVFAVFPLPYHSLNFLLHCLNAALLFFLIPKLLRVWAGTNWNLAHHRHTYVASAVATLVWALHPLRVEPVAWASALPCNQALFFTLLSLFLYLHPYVSHDSPSRARLCYWSSFVSFVAGLLSSPLVVMYPVLLILLGHYLPGPETGKTGLLRPQWPKWMGYVPFLLASLFALAVSFTARVCSNPDSLPSLAEFDFFERAIQACYVWTYYLWKVWWPQPLSPVYPALAKLDPFSLAFVLSGVGLVALGYVLVRLNGRWPTLWRLWVAHLVLLAPVLGLCQRPHFAADKFALFHGVLWSFLLAGILYRLCLRLHVRVIACGLSTVVVCVIAGLSASQVAVWQDTLRLYSHTLAVNPPGSPYHARMAILLAHTLRADDMHPESVAVLEELLEHTPEPEAHHLLAGWHFDKGNFEKAQFHYREAARLRPANPRFYNDLAVLLIQRGEAVVAQDILERAIAVDPHYPIAHHNLGLLLKEQSRTKEAQAMLARAQALRQLASP